jgi:hypothetical protein
MRDKQEELGWEARVGRLAGFAAIASAVLVVIAIVSQVSIGKQTTKDATKHADSLTIAHNHSGSVTAYAIALTLAYLVLIPALLYAYRVAKYRRPEVPAVTAVTAVLGPLLVAVTTIGGVLTTLHVANDFISNGPHTEARAKHLIDASSAGVFGSIGLAGALSTAAAFVLLGTHGMRSGIFSRFMGVLGIITGVLAVIPLTPVPIVQIFWSAALGLLFIGIWPGTGRGPAWETAEAIPWPSARDRLVEGQDGAGEPEPADAQPNGSDDEPAAVAQPNPRASRKRKKKARR